MPAKVISKKKPSAKTKKSSNRLNRLSFFTNRKVIVVVAFVVAFSGVGIYKLTQSHAASFIICDSQWREVPGAGRTIDTPDITYIPNGSVKFADTMMLMVRGTDNGVYYQPLWFYSGGHWDGSWYRLNNGSTVSTPRQISESGTYYGSGTPPPAVDNIFVNGTNGYSYTAYSLRSWDSANWSNWQVHKQNGVDPLPPVNTYAVHYPSNRSVSVRREADNRISYFCSAYR